MITYDYSNTKKGLKSVVPQVFNFDPISLIFHLLYMALFVC